MNIKAIQFTKSSCDTCIKSEASSMNIKAIQFTESSCDTCIKSEASSMNIKAIQFTESSCDTCIKLEACSVNITSNFIENTTVNNSLIAIDKGEFKLEEFSFTNNHIGSESRAIHFQSMLRPRDKVVLKNGFIEWNVDGNEFAIIDIREEPVQTEIVNVTVKVSSHTRDQSNFHR